MGKRWGFLGRLVSLREQKEPLGGEKVGSLKRVVSLEETLQLGMMMSMGIGCSTVGTKKWGFLGQYRGCISREGRGAWPKERFVSIG